MNNLENIDIGDHLSNIKLLCQFYIVKPPGPGCDSMPGQVMTLSGAFSHRGWCLAVSVWIMKIVMTICSGASRDNYHKPHGPSTDQNTSTMYYELWNHMTYPLFKGENILHVDDRQDTGFQNARDEIMSVVPRSPRPNWLRTPRPAPAWWRRPPPAWAGSHQPVLFMFQIPA